MCYVCTVNYKTYHHHKWGKIRCVLSSFKFDNWKWTENIYYLMGSGRRRPIETCDSVVVGSGQCAVFTLGQDNTRESRSLSRVHKGAPLWLLSLLTIARLTPDYSPSDDLIKCLLCAYVQRIMDELLYVHKVKLCIISSFTTNRSWKLKLRLRYWKMTRNFFVVFWTISIK